MSERLYEVVETLTITGVGHVRARSKADAVEKARRGLVEFDWDQGQTVRRGDGIRADRVPLDQVAWFDTEAGAGGPMSDVERTAETLLLAMDGDFLPLAGMGVDNEGQDVPLDQARPKEVAWWAAHALAPLLAEVRAEALAEGERRGGVKALRDDHRVIVDTGVELVCSCGAHLSVYGLTRSTLSVFAEHVRTARAAALASEILPLTHTRMSTNGYGPDFCAECSEAIKDWVSWPCARAAALASGRAGDVSGENDAGRWARTARGRTTCLVAVWDDGIYRVRCSMGTKGRCAKHGPHQPHPDDGRPCQPNPHDGYCHTHGVYMDPRITSPGSPDDSPVGKAGGAGDE